MTHNRLPDVGAARSVADAGAVQPTVDDSAAAREPFGHRRVRAARLAAVAAVATVFLVHFRPWQDGLLEDWGLALAWENEGIGGLGARVPAMVGRPFHLLPQYLGFLVSDGGFVGPYGVLAFVAVGQLLVGVWALRPLVASRAARWVLALAISLHPWWAAGDILRFLPAQVSVLAFVGWLGASIRFIQGGRRSWVLAGSISIIVGLLTYQALAAAVVVAAVVLALTAGSDRTRRLVLVGATGASSAAVVLWSVAIAPILSPASYEAGLSAGSVDLGISVRAVLRTIVLHSPGVAVFGVAVGLLLLALGLSGRVTAVASWSLLAGLVGAPATALVYASQSLHLNDPERVGLPVGVTLWLVLCCVARLLGSDRRTERGVLAVLLAGVLLGAASGYATWTSYSVDQQGLLRAVDEVRQDVDPGVTLVVADLTGRYGDVYSLLPPHLDLALQVELGPGASATLCTPADVVRDQPVALEYPIATTPDCAPLLDAATVLGQTDVTTPQGPVRIYELAPLP